MSEKAFQQLLSLNPERLQLASENAAVRKWNLSILDDLVVSAVKQFPAEPSREDLDNYYALSKRLRQFSKQFVERPDAEYGQLAEHIDQFAEKIQKEDDPRVRFLFSHYITKKILKFGGVIDSESANSYRHKLIDYIDSKLNVAIPQLKRKSDREKVRVILENLVAIQHAMDRYDIDGSLDEKIREALKQFLFNGVKSHHIYQNLLSYEAGSFHSDDPKHCLEAAQGIHNFIFQKLVPFLRDPDVEPSREDVEKITENLKILNAEFSGNLLSISINVLESFL